MIRLSAAMLLLSSLANAEVAKVQVVRLNPNGGTKITTSKYTFRLLTHTIYKEYLSAKQTTVRGIPFGDEVYTLEPRHAFLGFSNSGTVLYCGLGQERFAGHDAVFLNNRCVAGQGVRVDGWVMQRQFSWSFADASMNRRGDYAILALLKDPYADTRRQPISSPTDSNPIPPPPDKPDLERALIVNGHVVVATGQTLGALNVDLLSGVGGGPTSPYRKPDQEYPWPPSIGLTPDGQPVCQATLSDLSRNLIEPGILVGKKFYPDAHTTGLYEKHVYKTPFDVAFHNVKNPDSQGVYYDLDPESFTQPESIGPLDYSRRQIVEVLANDRKQLAVHVQWASKRPVRRTGFLKDPFPTITVMDAIYVGTPVDAGPELTLHKATTTDSESITVTYDVAGTAAKSPVTYSVYRAAQESVDESQRSSPGLAVTKIGGGEFNGSDLSLGEHSIQVLKGTKLPPDPHLPYVVVVTHCNGKSSQTYFKKWMLGVVIHGFAGKVDFTDPTGPLIADPGTMTWVNAMCDSLTNSAGNNRFDHAIPCEWIDDSFRNALQLTKPNGDRFFTEKIEPIFKNWKRDHDGDVVDIYFIAHSRGCIVVSRILQDMVSKAEEFKGSWVGATLLDPHPANNELVPSGGKLFSYRGDPGGKFDRAQAESSSFPTGDAVRGCLIFQATAQDENVVIPAGSFIKEVSVWWQHTPSWEFGLTDPESYLNLWGEGENDNLLVNQSVTPIRWVNVTGNHIGHTEIHELYQRIVSEGLRFGNPLPHR